MKKNTWMLVSVFLLASTTFAQTSPKKIPAADVKTMDGKTVNTSTIENDGKPIVINFWATWCKPCVKELNAISDEYSNWQKETGVKIVIISEDDARTSMKAVQEVKTRGWEYESYLDVNQDFKRVMNVNNCPHTFLLNGKGEVVWQHNSYSEGDEDKLYENIKKVSRGEKPE